ncbi:branched-chain amino acid ABC transporter permease [Demetria terragena]|uniref:branched-chain amino acid ABC transporter permease n=1 Tax=Demetria terragena TaxID=63959 RepID=UPI00036C8F71|nr:branched-chain amino acid ABC transporter permease [Demetria terragena]
MDTLVQVLVNGLGKGAVLALLAVGFVVIFKATETVNFAHGSMAIFSGYIAYSVMEHTNWLVGAFVGVLAGGLLGLFIERVFLSNAKGAHSDSLAILTIGLDVVIFTEILRRIGTGTPPFLGEPYDGESVSFLGASVALTYIVALAVALILLGVFFAAFRYTSWGLSMRAQAENKEAAALMGIRSWRVTSSAWFVGGLLAGIAVLFLATNALGGGNGLVSSHTLAFAAFPAAIIGGLTSPGGAVVGGVVVGLTEALAAQYIDRDFAVVAVYLVMLAVLVVRPAGLFGRMEQVRV